ncbi:hypothetical protein [Brevundimonas sp. A19_0]|uniref:hypothetical protein n=1 Tax=Brevundimonas sp. A19_0 TaxID=2821087 RepID=UPI001ADD2929|nr:hypothetical protein [Brevundimonas sp. A19_0]MBO9502688.1 hypothetical protein [Brevundimonas sp. A19_0]
MTEDPKDALASIREAREGVTGTLTYPVGWDFAYGAICGLMVASQGLPTPWAMLALVIALAGLAISVQWWRNRVGWWVSGYSPKRARWVAIGLAVILIALMGLSIWGKHAGMVWMPLATGAAGFVSAIIGGRLWMHVWKRELSEAQG